MNNRMYKLVVVVGFILVNNFPVTAQESRNVTDLRQVALDWTEKRTLHSGNVGQDYEILVSLPKSYSRNNDSYPVIYLLDAYRAFFIMKGCLDLFTIPSPRIPEVILVGIGYGGKDEEALLNWTIGRTRDLTPAKSSAVEEGIRNTFAKAGYPELSVTTGGASHFLEFMKDELIPFIESNYKVDRNARILAGYSYGGLFALYVLFKDPVLFDKYFIGSPTIDYENGIIYGFESDFATNFTGLRAEVFLTSGELEKETARNLEILRERLLYRNYEGLYLETFIFPGENHLSCYPAAISRALIELFNNK